MMALMPKFFSRRTSVVVLLTAFSAVIGFALRQAGPGPGQAPNRGGDGPEELASSGRNNGAAVQRRLERRASEPAKQQERSVEDRRQALIEAAQNVDGRAAERLFAAAIRDADASVRREALELSATAGEPAIDQLVLEAALQDSDAELRDLAFHRTNELPVRVRIDVFAGALHGASTESAVKAADWLAVLGGKPAAQALVSAWPRLTEAGRVSAVRRALERLTGRQFASAAEAQAWWSATADRLDETLLPAAR